MNIALFYPGKLPVAKYGGTERVVVWLAQALHDLGNSVTVIAGRGTELENVSVVEIDVSAANRHDFDIAAFIPGDIDLVHFFVLTGREWGVAGIRRTGAPRRTPRT